MNAYELQHHETMARYAPAEAAGMLQAIDPLFAQMPVYLIARTQYNANQLPTFGGHDVRGWTGIDLSTRCQSWLESQGEWRGPGFAMIYHDPIASQFDASFFATVVHEAGHYLEWQVTTSERHGPTWIRATLHLLERSRVWRTARNLSPIQARDVMPMANYKRSSAEHYQRALGDEIYSAWKSPLCRTLREPPPKAFVELAKLEAPPPR